MVEALNTLGFQEYVADVEAVHKEYKEQASVRSHTRAALALEVSADSLNVLCQGLLVPHNIAYNR